MFKWMRKSLNKLLKKGGAELLVSLERAAQQKTPVVISLAPWTVKGAYSILVNGTDVARVMPLEAAQSRARVIHGYLRTKGYGVVLEV